MAKENLFWKLDEITDEEAVYGYSVVSKVEAKDVLKSIKRVVLLNSSISFDGYISFSYKISIDKVKELINEAKSQNISIESYIGHEATAKLIENLLGLENLYNRAMFVPSDSEFIIIAFKLKKRLERPEDIQNVKAEDIEVVVSHNVRIF